MVQLFQYAATIDPFKLNLHLWYLTLSEKYQ